MPTMDISDVAYDAFLINGHESSRIDAFPGDTVRLRIINAGASGYFYIQFSGGPVRVIAADGLDVQPVENDRILIAIAETYDVEVTLPNQSGTYEFRATAQDGSGHASVFLGRGWEHPAPDIPKPNLYMVMHGGMDSSMTMNLSDQDMPDQEMRPMPPYEFLRSPYSTALDQSKPLREITLSLTGDMERYIWSFDGKTLTEADVISISHGENVRITFVNKTMMHHPIHFHGHFFRVANRHGDYSPLKHTVDISPLSTQVIEFYASEEKDWFLHCHILYHMKAGMARVVSYEGSSPDPDIQEARKLPSNFLKQDPWYGWGRGALLTQMTYGRFTAANTRNTVYAQWEHGWDEDETTIDLIYSRYFNRFISAFAGLEITNEDNLGLLGVTYLLPLLFEGTVRADTDGEWRFALEIDAQLTDRIYLFGEGEFDTATYWEWQTGIGITATRRLSLIGLYHSEFGIGGGLNLEF